MAYKRSIFLCAALAFNTAALAMEKTSLKVATFNVSMEALNYLPKEANGKPTGSELNSALQSNHQQIKNIAEIIQRVNPDVILLNEFDRRDNSAIALKTFITQYLNKSQHQQSAVDYPYFYQGSVNTGELTPFDINGDGNITHPQDTYGFGHFSGHFGMALLSKYPIDHTNIRTFQHFKWKDMPNALKPVQPDSGESYYPEEVWQGLRLSSKSHWDVPIIVNGKVIHILASHPTPPVFDGPEDRNGKRNHDELRFWSDYLTPEKSAYIYDDNKVKGGKKGNFPFVILGDLNASNTDGDANDAGISSILNHQLVNDTMPTSQGGKLHREENINGQYHTAYWGMRADYVLPSKHGWTVTDSGVFWPTNNSELYRLIDSRSASSDHRLVWVELELK